MKTNSAKVPDQVLVKQLRDGNAQAVNAWFTSFQPRLERYVQTRLSDPADVQEIVQQTFINSLKNLMMFKAEASLLTWMQSIARHEIADYYRKKYAKKAIQLLPLSDLLPQLHQADSHEVAEQVKEVVKRLSVHHRELLMLKYIDDKKVEDIAAELGKSVKSIESDLFRARQAFKVLYLDMTAAA